MQDNYFNWEVDKVETTADVTRLVLALFSGIKLLTAALGYTFFTEDLYVAIANIIPLLIVIWTTWKHNYVTKKGKAQKLVLAKYDLIEKEPHEIVKKDDDLL